MVDLTFLLQGTSPKDQLGYHTSYETALASSRLTGYTPFPYRGAKTRADWIALFDSVLVHMRDSGSNVLFLQYFHSPEIPDPRPFIDSVRALPQKPIVATSCGDGFGPRNPPPRSLIQASSRSDITFTTSMGKLAGKLERAGGRRITLMANSACDIRFAPTAAPLDRRDFDIVFIGSRPGGRNPTNRLFWAGRKRKSFVQVLSRRYGSKFGLFGNGWQANPYWQGPAAFDDQAQVCQRGRVVFGGFPGSTEHYYTSNRPFIQMLSSVPFVDMRVPLVDRILRDGSDWLLFDDVEGATKTIDDLLEGRLDADAIGQQGADSVRERHLNSHRVELTITVLEELLEARRVGREAKCPPLDFLLEESRASSDASALRAW